MKNIIKILSFMLVFAAVACEPEEYATPNIDLVPVYTVSETGNNNYSIVRIYRQKNYLTVMDKDGGIAGYTTKDYSDISDEITYNVSVVALDTKTVTDEEGKESEVQITHSYAITAPLETGVCVLTITSYDETGGETGVVTINGILSDEEVYN